MSASEIIQPAADTTKVLVRRLLRDYIRRHWPRLIVAFVCMAIFAAANAGTAWLMEPVIDDVFVNRDEAMLYTVAAAILAFSLIKGVSGYVQSVIVENTGQRMVADLQIDMYRRLIRADLGFFHEHPIGMLLSRFTNDANLLRLALVRTMTSMCKDTLTFAFMVMLMFYQDWRLALCALFVFPVAVFPIVRIGQRMRKISSNAQTEIGDLSTALDETFQGVRVVKAYGMEDREVERTRNIVDGVFRQFRRAARVRFATAPIMEILGGIVVAGIILYGGWQVIAGVTTAGAFFSFLAALLLAYQPLKAVANSNAYLQEGLAAVQRVFAVLDVSPTIADRPDASALSVAGGAIRFDDVRFSYGGAATALNGVDLDVPAGCTVALVGPSGAGKSTVMNLLPRFYDVDHGVVTIDGRDVRDVTLVSLRANIALVSQEIGLFDDTVRANIAYGRPDAIESEIIDAARNAAAHDFILGLSDGYDTRIGGGGRNLSGGQRQRLSIARAMLKDAPVLLLDEATSALDTESERQVQAALARLKQGRTTLVIAHRLSTVVDADLICVMEEGRIVERGTHAELVARGGAYARLYALQFADSGEVAAAVGG